MKVRAITPDEAERPLENDSDRLIDIEIETIVARINCILRRSYDQTNLNVVIPKSIIGWGIYGPSISAMVITRFEKMGWTIKEDTRLTSEGKRQVYIFSRRP